MRIGLLVTLLCVVAAAFALTACGLGTETLKGAARVADELGTVVNSAHATTEPSSIRFYRPTPASDVKSVILILNSLTIADRGSNSRYLRDDWRHWVDDDRDCQNTRAEVLIEESLAEIDFAGNEDCRVVVGEWLGPWSGEIFTDASEVDIDHHVPLGHAHEAGFAGNEDCRVVVGEWLGPWSGEIFTDASEVDIDHHVPWVTPTKPVPGRGMLNANGLTPTI